MKIVKGSGGGIAFRIDPSIFSLLQSSSLENGSDGQFLHCACMRSSVLLKPSSQAKWSFSARSGGGFRPDEYEFVINQDGSYSVDAFTPDTYGAVLAQGFSPAIHRGLNQTNPVAAVVHGKIIELYVNHQRVAVVDSGDSGTYTPLTHGLIGVIAANSPESTQTEVIVQNAKVWKL
jgi:hypothetical protein